MSETSNLNIWFPGRPHSLLEQHIKRPMQSISLMDYQGLIRRSVLAAAYNTAHLPLQTNVFLEISLITREKLDIVAATKAIMDALKKLVYSDDARVRTLTVRIDDNTATRKRGPAEFVNIAIGGEESIVAPQPFKTLEFLLRVSISTKPVLDEPPHSKDGMCVDPTDPKTEPAVMAIRQSVKKGSQPLTGGLMVSMKILTTEHVLDLDNVAGIYIRALEGVVYEQVSQIKLLHITFMDTDTFGGEEGVYMTIEAYNPREW